MKPMEELLKSIAGQTPGLVVYLLLIWIVFRYLERRDADYRLMHAEHVDERRQCRLSVEANARALSATAIETQKNINETNRNTEALNNLAHVIKEKVKL